MTHENSIAISFQGAPGAFSHAAALSFARQLSSENAQMISCPTFGEVFARVIADRTTYGAVPLENSSIGSIVANYDLLWEHDAVIVAEYMLPVHHQLIGFPGTRVEDLKLVYSHPAALDQCRNLFRNHENLAPRVHWDTSGSVIHVKESGDRSNAAIAGVLAAKEHGMAVLAEDVEDYPVNATRFGLIAAGAFQRDRGPADSFSLEKSRTAAPNKISFAVELMHEVGALSRLLAAIAVAGANLTKIESRPIGSTPWHYRFFMDAEVPTAVSEAELEEALRPVCVQFKPLGRYHAGTANQIAIK